MITIYASSTYIYVQYKRYVYVFVAHDRLARNRDCKRSTCESCVLLILRVAYHSDGHAY